MRPRVIEALPVLSDEPAELVIVDHDHVVEHLPAPLAARPKDGPYLSSRSRSKFLGASPSMTYDGYSKESDRKTYATLTWVGYGVGAACVLGGAILYAIGLKARAESTGSVALVPYLNANHAGAALAGAF